MEKRERSHSLIFLIYYRHDNPRERMRNRVNSFSLQMDLDGVQLGTTTEVITHTHNTHTHTHTYTNSLTVGGNSGISIKLYMDITP